MSSRALILTRYGNTPGALGGSAHRSELTDEARIRPISPPAWIRPISPPACWPFEGRIAEDRANCDLIAKEEAALQQLVLMALSENPIVVGQACKTMSERPPARYDGTCICHGLLLFSLLLNPRHHILPYQAHIFPPPILDHLPRRGGCTSTHGHFAPPPRHQATWPSPAPK